MRKRQPIAVSDASLRVCLTIAAIAVLAVARLWVLPAIYSFRVDETLIVWTIRNGFAQIAANTSVSLQSIAFCWVEWLVTRVLGSSEIAFRLPSVLAAISSLYVYYRLGVESADRETGLIFAGLYLSVPQVAFLTPAARPYSIGLLAEAAALLWLLRWLRSGRIQAGLLWAACAVAACYMQSLFVMPLAIESAFVLWRAFRMASIPARQAMVCISSAIALLLPALSQILVMSREAQLLSFAQVPTLAELAGVIVPLQVLAPAALIALLLMIEKQPLRWTDLAKCAGPVTLGALLLLLPAFGLFALSGLTSVHLFQERYLLPAAPGLVLLWGSLLRAVEPPFFRRMSLAAGLVVSLVVLGRGSIIPNYRPEDWRSAVRSMPDSGAFLLYSGLVEARRLDWLEQPDRWGYLMAPVLAYRPSIAPQNGFPIPFEFGPSDQAYMARLLQGPLRDRDTVTVIVLRSFGGPAWLGWISERLSSVGFRVASDVRFTNVEVAVLHRPSAGRDRASANLILRWPPLEVLCQGRGCKGPSGSSRD